MTGNPAGSVPGKNAEHDARIYATIFAEEFPDVAFVSGGSSREVIGDFFGLAAALPKVATGMRVRRLIDRDDHSPTAVEDFEKLGITVLSRRHLESYLWDDEVLTMVCNSLGRAADINAVLSEKEKALKDSVARGNMDDDMEKAVGPMYSQIKRILKATQMGNDPASFARDTLAPQIKPGTAIYDALKKDIFSS